ncbi:coagulation factor IX-like [Rhineura floridana]|uniref:coagulation factor IX-like n=1 Tax=Rhineura floridana TaxID=261503 RepID=UPI002AC814A8|nr:coagulation factor IX-like [Rhineura floridana]
MEALGSDFSSCCLLNGPLTSFYVEVFINQDKASAVLPRYRRHNTGLLEEVWEGNLERECMEEVCVYEEAREVFENDEETIKFWKKYTDCDDCKSNPCMNGGRCEDQISSYRCLCPPGYEGKNCELDHTCSTNNGGCKQICENGLTGTAICSCAPGYRLKDDQKSCEPTVPFPCGRIAAPEAVNSEHASAGREASNDRPWVVPMGPTPNQGLVPVNNTDSKKGEVPWQVYMLSYERKGWCGGTIISEKWVVTAAHCLEHGPHTVVAGDFNTEGFDGTEQLRQVVKAIPYPTYNSSNRYHNDIALLELDSPLKLSHYITPICLAGKEFTNSLLKRGSGTVSGWWRLGSQRRRANILQVLKVHQVDQATCLMNNRSSILPNMFCAAPLDTAMETHQGDSGGPYAIDMKGTSFLTAVTSCGEQCDVDLTLSFQTKLSNYIKWIESAVTYHN